MDAARFFAKLVLHEEYPHVNLMWFEGTTVHQKLTTGNEQSGEFSKFSYNRATGMLYFTVNGSVEKLMMHEITEATGRKLLEPHNWENLLKGLGKRSPATLAWLQEKGVRPDTSSAYRQFVGP